MKVIYFNQWFSSIANVIDDIKNKYKDSFKIIGSSRTAEHSYKYSVDKFIVEDWEGSEDYNEQMKNYTDWVLNLCKTENVDIFFVKKHAKHIMERAEEFEKLGVKLISEDYDTLNSVESKSNVYEMLSYFDEMHNYIPEYHIFIDKQRAIDYINNHREKNDICFKFDRDEGGASFRHIKDTKPTVESLYAYELNKINSDDAIELIESIDDISRLIFMEMLDSPEISIDCYKSSKGFIALPRVKADGRKQKIFYNKELSDLCENIGDNLGLKFPYNVQFRVQRGQDSEKIENLRLLEVNPRMSGGLYYEVLCGMNIAEISLLDNIGESDKINFNLFINFEDKYVTYVEKAILINE